MKNKKSLKTVLSKYRWLMKNIVSTQQHKFFVF